MFLIAQPWHCFLSLACLSTLGHKDETHREWFVVTGEDANWLYFYFCLHLYLTQFRAARRDQIRLGFENALEIWHSLSLPLSVEHFDCVQKGSKINVTFLVWISIWRVIFKSVIHWIEIARDRAFQLVSKVAIRKRNALPYSAVRVSARHV